MVFGRWTSIAGATCFLAPGNQTSFPPFQLRGFSDYIGHDEDGLYYIDYIGGLVNDDYEPEEWLRLFENHRDAIGAAHAAAPDIAKLKYQWLSMYHNSRVKLLGPELLTYFGRQQEEFMCQIT